MTSLYPHIIAWTPLLFAALTTPAWAQAPLNNLDEVQQLAGEVYEAHPGAAAAQLAAGLRGASGRVPGRVQALTVAVSPALDVAPEDSMVGDSVLGLGLDVDLSRRPALARDALVAEAAAAGAASHADRHRFVLEAQRRYLAWWRAASVAAHLREDLTTFEAQLEPLRKARDRGLLSPLDEGEFEAALSQIRQEAMELERAALGHELELEDLLGQAVTLPTPAEDALRDPLGDANPWSPLLALLTNHPELRALEAEGRAAELEAEASDARPWSLGLGAEAHRDGTGATWLVGGLSLSIPLEVSDPVSVSRAQARAAASRSDRGWRQAQLEASLRRAQAAWEADALLARDMAARWLPPLERRVALMEEAAAAGQIELQRVIRARRELHEARHRHHTLLARLRSQEMRARAELQLLRATP